MSLVTAGYLPGGARASYATQTTQNLQLYANGTTGLDTNDGLTVGTPKLTLQAVFDLIPDFVNHNIAINLAGIFNEFGSVYLANKIIKPGKYLVIDGGASFTIINDNGGANFTGDIHSASTIGQTGAGWGVNAYQGLIVEIIDGAYAGQNRLIRTNTADTITVNTVWGGDVGLNTKFRIVVPATTISSSVANSYLYLGTMVGAVIFSRLYFTGAKCFISGYAPGSGTFYLGTGVVSSAGNTTSTHPIGTVYLSDTFINPATFAVSSTNLGCSLRHTLSLKNINAVTVLNSMVKTLYVGGTAKNSGMIYKSYIYDQAMFFGIHADQSAYQLYTATLTSAGAYPAFLAIDSSLVIRSDCDFSNPFGHGIESKKSFLRLTGAITGTCVGGAGVYAHSGSVIHTTSGSPPTLTGTVGGDLSVDGTTQATTWAAIEAGTNYTNTDEMTMAKKV